MGAALHNLTTPGVAAWEAIMLNSPYDEMSWPEQPQGRTKRYAWGIRYGFYRPLQVHSKETRIGGTMTSSDKDILCRSLCFRVGYIGL